MTANPNGLAPAPYPPSAVSLHRTRLRAGEPLLSATRLTARAIEEAALEDRLAALLEQRRRIIDE